MHKLEGEERKFEATVRTDEADGRLDRFLASKFSEWSRTRLKRLILDGRVRVGDRTISDPEYRVKPAERIELTVPAPEPAKPGAESIPLDIVYEDDALIVINALQSSSNATPAIASSGSGSPVYYDDVNGDGTVSALDVLWIINDLLNATTTATHVSAAASAARPSRARVSA